MDKVEQLRNHDRYLYLSNRVDEMQLDKCMDMAREMAEDWERAHAGAECAIYLETVVTSMYPEGMIVIRVERPMPA